MSLSATAWAMKVEGLSPTAKFVLVVLADAHNGHSGDCFPSIARIAETTGYGESTVKYAIRDLEAGGLLRRETQTDHNGRTKGVQYCLSIGDGRGHQPTPGGHMTGGEGSPDDGGRGHMTPPHKEEPEKGTGKRTGEARALRLPPDWIAPDPFIEFAITEGLTNDEARRLVEPQFRDYWVSARDGAKRDWSATWRNWVRRDAPRIIRSRDPQAARYGSQGGGRLAAYQRAAAHFSAPHDVPRERADLSGHGGRVLDL
jgi:hypothetical protein